MTFASQTTRVEAGLGATWFSGLVETVKTKLRQREIYMRTMSELSTLDDREMRDLGLSSSMFRQLAREAAKQA